MLLVQVGELASHFRRLHYKPKQFSGLFPSLYSFLEVAVDKLTYVTSSGFYPAFSIPLHLDLKLGLLRTVVDAQFVVKAAPLEQAACRQFYQG